MTCCLVYCTNFQDINKTKKCQKYALDICRSGFFSILVNSWEDISPTLQTFIEYQEELGNCFYMTQWYPEPLALDLQVAVTLSQCLLEAFYYN